MIRAARVVAVILAALVVALVGLPALLGWVAVPAGADDAGVSDGALVVLEPGSGAVPLEAGDVIAVAPDPGRVALREVQESDGVDVTVAGPRGVPTQVNAADIGAVAMYQVPFVGHLVSAVPADHRPWWARAGAALFLLWAAFELWSTRRPRDAEIVEDEPRTRRRMGPTLPSVTHRRSLASRRPSASAPGADVASTDLERRPPQPARGGGGDRAASGTNHADDDVTRVGDPARVAAGASPGGSAAEVPVAGGAHQTRRSRSRARRGPWDDVVGLLASAVGTVVLAARSFDRRSGDPADQADASDPADPPAGDGGRHRAAGPVTSVDITADDRRRSRARHRRARTEHPAQQDPAPHDETLWQQRPSNQDVAAAARVQDFEARRAAAAAAFTHDLDLPSTPAATGPSPAERLLAQVEAKSKQVGPSAEQAESETETQPDR